ncbi:mobilome CxxCx(11)CxxC protein, partial [Vibrio cholerae]
PKPLDIWYAIPHMSVVVIGGGMEKSKESEYKVDRNEKKKAIAHFEFLSYGTAQIFEIRANRLKKLRSVITFLGIVLPVFVGGVYISFGQSKDVMSTILVFAGIAGVLQLVLSTWSLVSGWDSKYELAIKSLQGNTANFNSCKRFSNAEYRSDAELLTAYDSIVRDIEQQELIDITQHISKAEKHLAYVSALTYYNRSCHVCETNPNHASTLKKCSSCGQKRK